MTWSNDTSVMMMSSNGNSFRVTGPLWGEFTSHLRIPLKKARDAELWCFLWTASEQTIETTAIWDAILWRHCNVKSTYTGVSFTLFNGLVLSRFVSSFMPWVRWLIWIKHDSVSNHQPNHCLLNRSFRRKSKKTSKLRVTGLCVGNSPGPVNSPHKGPVTRKMFPFDDVIMFCSRMRSERSHYCRYLDMPYNKTKQSHM